MQTKSIVLTTLNARYSHASIGLRYLFANLKELRGDAVIREFVINENVQAIAEQILDHAPRIVGIGVYIWNASDVSELIEVIKKVSPETVVVLGGPEASHLPFRANFDAADYFIQGEGEVAFYELCRDLLAGKRPEHRMIRPPLVDLNAIALPYDCYDDHDVANRYIYVESSRGCPFLCEFCLSAIDEKVRYFPLEPLLEQLGIGPVFGLILSGDSLPRKKPDPLPLRHAAEFFSVTPAQSLMVGDSENDVKAARAAEFPVVCVDYGYNHGNDIRTAGPDAVIHSLAELSGVFD